MNFSHSAHITLPAKSGDYRFFRITIPQISVEDPENVGCGHKYKLINEWTLRKILYANYIARFSHQ